MTELTIKVVAAEPEKPKKDAPPVNDWPSAGTAMRDAAKWIIVALGSVGVAVFGAGPIIKGLSLDWTSPADQAQLVWAMVLGLIGLGGIVGLIWVVGHTLMPVVVTLGEILPSTQKEVEANSGELLPDGVTSVSQLRAQLLSTPAALRWAQQNLAQLPPTATAAQKAAAESTVSEVTALRQTLVKWSDSVLRRDAYNRLRERFVRPLGSRTLLIALIVAAVVGSVGFMFALSTPVDDEDAAGGSAAPVKVAYLSPGSDDAAWDALAANFDFDSCAIDGRMLVLVTASDGDLRTVRTLPQTPECAVWEFDVIDPSVARVEVLSTPRTIEITYSPAPSPSTSGP